MSGVIKNLFWFILDAFNYLFWFVFDSWRKPSVELFARMSTDEAIQEMIDAYSEKIAIAEFEDHNPVTGYFGKSHFSLLKWARTPYGKVAVIQSTILYGRIYDVNQGVFIRAWHRLPTVLLIFMGLWFGILTSSIIESIKVETGYLTAFAFVLAKILITICCLLFFMWVSTKFAREVKNEINLFLKNIFSRTTEIERPRFSGLTPVFKQNLEPQQSPRSPSRRYTKAK